MQTKATLNKAHYLIFDLYKQWMTLTAQGAGTTRSLSTRQGQKVAAQQQHLYRAESNLAMLLKANMSDLIYKRPVKTCC